jgi:membrane-bound inhibitor of C-type lysozyme
MGASILLRAPLLVAIVFVASCATHMKTPSDRSSGRPSNGYARYRCADAQEFGVTYQQNGRRALLEADGWSYVLRAVPTAGGAQYSDGKITLRTTGRSATVDRDGVTTHQACSVRSEK